jgi:hypothetical protein
LDCFKAIYDSNYGYRDVAQRVESSYAWSSLSSHFNKEPAWDDPMAGFLTLWWRRWEGDGT